MLAVVRGVEVWREVDAGARALIAERPLLREARVGVQAATMVAFEVLRWLEPRHERPLPAVE
jgi:hypothetical protein